MSSGPIGIAISGGAPCEKITRLSTPISSALGSCRTRRPLCGRGSRPIFVGSVAKREWHTGDRLGDNADTMSAGCSRPFSRGTEARPESLPSRSTALSGAGSCASCSLGRSYTSASF